MIEVRMKNKKRIIIGFMIIAFLMILLCLRTAWIQVVKADDYSETATNQQMSDIPLEAERGSIFDRNGQQMAVSATCYSMWVRPAQITENYDNEEKYTELCQKLAVILDAKAADLRKELKQDSTLVCIARYLDKSQRDKIADLEIPGVELSEGTRRYYPMKTSAAKLLGSVTDDGVGRTGIESEFDKYLSGVSGRWIKATDLNGDTLSYGKQTLHQAKNGYNVHLTVDEVLQHYAEEAAEKGMKDTKASRVMILVMNPKNGDVLAMAATPSFDPNNATAPLSSSDKKAYDKTNSNLLEYCDEYLDMECEDPDIAIDLDGIKIGQLSSTVTNVLAQMLTAEIYSYFIDKGKDAPVLLSANINGADVHNNSLTDPYGRRIR